MGKPKIEVLIVDDIPTPYRNNLYRDIAEKSHFSLSLLFLAKKGNEKKWRLVPLKNIKVFYLKCLQFYIKSIDTRVQISFGVFKTLIKLRPDLIVVGGYHQLGYWTCLLYAKLFSKKICIWSGTTENSEQRNKNLFLKIAKTFYIQNVDFGFAYGSDAMKFLIKNKMPSDKIFIIFNTSDLLSIREKYKSFKAIDNKNNGETRIIFVGRLTRLKGIQQCLYALSLLGRNNIKFRILGDGPYRNELQRLSEKLNLSSQVEYFGYAQQEEIAEHLAWADIFLFASIQEVWGIVVNEALASGLYVLSSRLAGCTTDLIIENFTGRVIDPYKIEEMVSVLDETNSRIEEVRFGREARSIWAMKYSSNNISEDFIKAVYSIISAEK